MSMTEIAKMIQEKIRQDKVARIQTANGWLLRFNELSKKMSQSKFCEKYGFDTYMLSRYMHQDINAVINPKKKQSQPRIASWKKIEDINAALLKEGIKELPKEVSNG